MAGVRQGCVGLDQSYGNVQWVRGSGKIWIHVGVVFLLMCREGSGMLDSGCPETSRDMWTNAKSREAHGPVGETVRSAGMGIGDSTGQYWAWGRELPEGYHAIVIS